MKALAVLAGLALSATPAAAQTEVIPFGNGVMIQPQGGPPTTLMPGPNNGTQIRPPGGQTEMLSSIGNGQPITPPPEAPLNTAPMMVTPFSASSTVIQKPGEPPIVCTRIGNAINCN